MSVQKPPQEHRCPQCGKPFTSMARLQHHRAAEHAPKTQNDIRHREALPELHNQRALTPHLKAR